MEGDLLARVKQLEGVVSELRGKHGRADESDEHEDDDDDNDVPGKERITTEDGALRRGTREMRLEPCLPDDEAGSLPNDIDKEFGRLVVDEEGKSRYGSSILWASLSEQVEDIKEILNETSEEEEDYYPNSEVGPPSSLAATIQPLHHRGHSCHHQGFLFGYSSLLIDMRALHPPAAQIPFYWQVFKDGVDPLIKIAHVPTTEIMIMKVARDRSQLEGISRGVECLLFAIYHAAVTSLTAQECQDRLGAAKSDLLDRYRFGVEQAMSRAGLLNTQELIVLQAFVTFLVSCNFLRTGALYDGKSIIFLL